MYMYNYIDQSLTYQHIPVPRVPSSKASSRIQQRRCNTLTERRVSMNGTEDDAEKQLAVKVKALSATERKNLLVKAEVGPSIDATQLLTIKAELSIPWYRLRILRT